MIQLRGQSFVMCQNQRGAPGLLDQLGHGEGLARPGHAEEDLMLLTGFNTAIELVNRDRLVAARLIIAVQLEFHGMGLLKLRRPLPNPSLYSGRQAVAFDGETRRQFRIRADSMEFPSPRALRRDSWRQH